LRYLVTGGAGYIGSRFVETLAERRGTTSVLVADLHPPRLRPVKTNFHELDVREAEAVARLVESERPDVLVHMAFLIDPRGEEPEMYEVNVNGTFNVLAGASRAGSERVMVLTATMAYGAWPDNPIPIPESQPVHGHAHYPYARHTTEADRIAQLWATLHPQRRMTIVRPCTVYGPGADNHLVRMWEEQQFFPDIGTLDQPTQFLHIDDAVPALVGLAEGGYPGVFNLVPDGEVSWRECAQIAGLETRPMREESFAELAGGLWRVGQSGAAMPPTFLDFVKYPWLAGNAKIKQALPEWQPRYSSRIAFEQMMQMRRVAREQAI
jgi:UDP-glucose 4-epimerase